MMNSFWWGHGGTNNRGINWISWEKLSMHTKYGGMGFKDLSAFKLAMLGKQGWKFQTEPQSLVSHILKARYFPNHSYLKTNLGHNPSYVWHSILRARFIVRGGLHWCIGPSNSIHILDEPWLLNGECIDGNITGAHFVRDFTVDSLIDNNSKSWNIDLVRQVFSEDITSTILQTPLINQGPGDHMILKAEKNDMYYVRSAYKLCVDELVNTSHLRRLRCCRLKVPPTVTNLGWRMCRGCLQTRVWLQDKGVQCSTNCVSSSSNHEYLAHIIFDCPFVVQVWQMAGLCNEVNHAVLITDSTIDAIFSLFEKFIIGTCSTYGSYSLEFVEASKP